MLIYTFLLATAVPLVFVRGAYEGNAKRLSFYSQNPNAVKVGAITLKDGKTAIFVYNGSSFWGYLTSDFYDYDLDTRDINHMFYYGEDDREDYSNNTLVPCFITYDPNTSGFGDDYLIGAFYGGANFIAAVYGDVHGDMYKYCENCISSRVLFDVSVSWDSQNNYWLGQVLDSNNVVAFATSPNLQTWQTQQWQIPIASAPLEIFSIADANDEYGITWIIVWKSEPDSYGRTKLMYGTFTAGDQNFQEIGVLVCSNNFVDFSIVNDNNTDPRYRNCLATLSSEPSTTSNSNTYVSCRTLTYSGGKLRQVPIPSSFGPMNKRSVVDLVPQIVSPGQDPLSNVTGSNHYQIDAKYGPNDGNCSFKLKVNPRDASQCAASVTISKSAITVETYSWQYADGSQGVGNVIYSDVIPFQHTVGDVVVLIIVNKDIIEYFIDNGLYAGSVQVSTDTDTTWDRCKLSASIDTQFCNLVYTYSVEKRTTVGSTHGYVIYSSDVSIGVNPDYMTGGEGDYTTGGVTVGDGEYPNES